MNNKLNVLLLFLKILQDKNCSVTAAYVGFALNKAPVPATPHSQHLIDFSPSSNLNSPCTTTLWKWQPKPAQSLKCHMQSWMFPVKWWVSMVKLVLMKEGRKGAEYRKFWCCAGVLWHGMPSSICFKSFDSSLIRVTQTTRHRLFRYRYIEAGESGSLQCKAFASADFHISYLSVVVCGFAELLK